MKNQTIKQLENYKIDYKNNFFTTKNLKKNRKNVIKNYIFSSLKAII